jgi:archaemetzincin
LWLLSSCGAATNDWARTIEALTPLHTRMAPPGPNDWLATHKESGQSFKAYRASSPRVPTPDRQTIFIQPIGAFSNDSARILDLTAELLGVFYGLPVRVAAPLPLSVVPAHAQRINSFTHDEQLLSPYILYDVLKPRLPTNAALYIALTTADLWPGEGWNFVFGQASLKDRVGVYSIARNGNPATSPEAFRLCLLRTLKIATHECGHMVSIHHCTAWECGMCGSNSRPESDRRPLEFCPECMAKVCWADGYDPARRFAALAAFCTSNGLAPEAALYSQSLTRLRAASTNKVVR